MIVLDTNVISELMLPSPNAGVVEWVARQVAPSLYLSTISEAELRYGVETLPTGQRRDGLLAEVEGMIEEVPFTVGVWAYIYLDRQANGTPRSPSPSPSGRRAGRRGRRG